MIVDRIIIFYFFSSSFLDFVGSNLYNLSGLTDPAFLNASSSNRLRSSVSAFTFQSSITKKMETKNTKSSNNKIKLDVHTFTNGIHKRFIFYWQLLFVPFYHFWNSKFTSNKFSSGRFGLSNRNDIIQAPIITNCLKFGKL